MSDILAEGVEAEPIPGLEEITETVRYRRFTHHFELELVPLPSTSEERQERVARVNTALHALGDAMDWHIKTFDAGSPRALQPIVGHIGCVALNPPVRVSEAELLPILGDTPGIQLVD